MSQAFDAIRTLFRRGEFGDLIRQTRLAPNLITAVDPSVRGVVAQALALTGQFERALELARADINSPLAVVRARAEYVLALVDQTRGHIGDAFRHLRSASRHAHEADDRELLAWIQLSMFRLSASMPGPDSNAIAFGDVRRAVSRAGDPHVTAYLHICVSGLEGQAGRFDEALRHCAIAEAILAREPHVWLCALLHLNRASITSLMCDFEQARSHVNAGRELAERSGDYRCVLMFDSNAAHIFTATGQFEAARRLYERLLKAPTTSSFTRLGAAEGFARLELALGSLDACKSHLDIVAEAVATQPTLALQYSVRWSNITRVRLLIKRGELQPALALLNELERSAQFVRDLPLTASIHLLFAQVYAAMGNRREAAARLAASSGADIAQFRELQPYYYAATADVLDDEHLGDQLRARAARVANHHGMAGELFSGFNAKGIGQTTDGSTLFHEVGSVGAISALFDLAFSPRLFASELRSLLGAFKVDVKTTEVRADSPIKQEPHELAFELELNQRRKLLLTVPTPEDPAKAIVVSEVLRIGRAALALERFRQEERARAALWPADPVETEAGALFLAEEMQDLLAIARRVAAANVPVLITGETGTGKEVLARLIHAYSPRAKAPFLPFNCSATPKDMLDSQLFGHRRGSFTGASDNFPGVIRAAAGGTLLLDEIGETGLDVQPKLLRFLESSEIHPIGETHPVRVDVRVIAATNADLDTLVAEGRFREDLFYRLNIVRLRIPPLRERRVEIPALANHYLRKFAHETQKGDLRLAEETTEFLVLYRWPGNVRQLANEMRRMAVLAEKGAVLMPEHLSPEIAASRRTLPPSARPLDDTEIVVRLDQPMPAGVAHIERAMIQYALKQCGGRLEETAALLGISRKGLYLKRQRYGMDPAPGELPPADVEFA